MLLQLEGVSCWNVGLHLNLLLNTSSGHQRMLEVDTMTEIEPKINGEKKGHVPIGNVSIKEADGSYKQVAPVWIKRSSNGLYLMGKAKAPFSMVEGDPLFMFLNSSEYRIAFIKRGTLIS